MRNLILQTFLILALLIYPLSLSAQNSFSLSLDVDSSAGDQAVTSLNASADQVIAIQIFGQDIQNANGLAARFEYDANQVVYEGFDTGDVLPNAQALPEQGTSFVEIGIASLGGQATANSGLVGTVRFRTTAAFSGTAIRLVRAELSRGGQFETVILNTRIELQFQAVTPDFDGDGRVGFADFLAFGNRFGARQGDGKYEAKYDLDSDGAIGFGDFLIFGRSFGQEISTPGGGGGGEETQVTIPDANLRVAIATRLGKASGTPITQADMATLTSLTAPKKDILDLTGLEFATGLTSLDLSNNEISDISVLTNLTNLTSLNLSVNIIADISPLSELTNLTSLSLYDDTTITDRSVLSRLSNLSEAYIPDANLRAAIKIAMGKTSEDPVTSFEMAFLSELEAPNSNIRDLTGLELASGLTSLDLGTEVVSGVGYVNSNHISDFSPLSGLINLTRLDLYSNDISDIRPLSVLTNLTNLWLGSNSISDIAPLSGLTSLSNLFLSSNGISDIAPLSGLTSLRVLNVSGNGISDISVLSRLTNLRWLYLDSNSILNVSALSGLTSLERLYLDSNSISNIAPLVANTGLGDGDQVDVRNNPLSTTSINTHIPTLQNRGVDVRFSASKPAVEETEPRMPHPENEGIVNGGKP